MGQRLNCPSLAITQRSWLKVGDEVIAIIKATEVMLGKP